GTLGHRRDYLGHYAAGYGGTLAFLALMLALIPENRFARLAGLSILPGTLLCIAGGTVTESTVFRLAKFDEVDYCNQNLGALLAGIAMMHIAGSTKPSDDALRIAIIIGSLFLIVGAYFALT
ncbi:MAG: hypothetical protein ACTHK7_17275, partial [Aureliella sp.]